MGILFGLAGSVACQHQNRDVSPREWEIRLGFKPLLIVAFPLARGTLCVCWLPRRDRPKQTGFLRYSVLGQQGVDRVRGLLCCGLGG